MYNVIFRLEAPFGASHQEHWVLGVRASSPQAAVGVALQHSLLHGGALDGPALARVWAEDDTTPSLDSMLHEEIT